MAVASWLTDMLLQAAEDWCDADRLPVYLEATSERSTSLYRRHGFVEKGALDMAPGYPPMIPMWRDPR